MIKEKDILWCTIKDENDNTISKTSPIDDHREQCKVCSRWFDIENVSRGVCTNCEKG
ncbi:hypothetical protein [Spiroplasma endosymbiont of Aspidapion aeneum]|uniref:hypothetical protein n=1 Tax=Spiroplasma endosymbiont of Aspidapion aeneum TaxID=3066276 RepID=UPI00313C798D